MRSRSMETGYTTFAINVRRRASRMRTRSRTRSGRSGTMCPVDRSHRKSPKNMVKGCDDILHPIFGTDGHLKD